MLRLTILEKDVETERIEAARMETALLIERVRTLTTVTGAMAAVALLAALVAIVISITGG